MMNKKVLMNLMMAMVVAGLVLTVSCAKKEVVTDATSVEDTKSDADQAALDAKARAEQERIKAQQLKEQAEAAAALKAAKLAAAKSRFLNQNIHFEYDSAALSSMAKMLLKEKAAWLADNPYVAVRIEGHCDERGTTEYNLGLGERRAAAVKYYLSDLGVAMSRMDTVSFGEERPLDMGQSEAAYRKNRRAQFVLK